MDGPYGEIERMLELRVCLGPIVIHRTMDHSMTLPLIVTLVATALAAAS